MFACDAMESHCIMQQEFILPANFYTMLIDNTSTPNLNSTLTLAKRKPHKMFCIAGIGGQQTHKGHMVQGTE